MYIEDDDDGVDDEFGNIFTVFLHINSIIERKYTIEMIYVSDSTKNQINLLLWNTNKNTVCLELFVILCLNDIWLPTIEDDSRQS